MEDTTHTDTGSYELIDVNVTFKEAVFSMRTAYRSTRPTDDETIIIKAYITLGRQYFSGNLYDMHNGSFLK